jgi:hypothetical protein
MKVPGAIRSAFRLGAARVFAIDACIDACIDAVGLGGARRHLRRLRRQGQNAGASRHRPAERPPAGDSRLPQGRRRVDRARRGPSFVITHSLPLEEGADAYRTFRDKADGCIKVVLKPHQASVH